MATRTTPSKPSRQLAELLQEQQEPFSLGVYLSEKGCGRKNLTCIHGHGSSSKFLYKSGSIKNKRNKGIPNFPKALKVILCNKLFGLKAKNSNDEDGNSPETAEADRFSSCSCSARCNSSSDSDIGEASMFTDNPKPSELYAGRKKKAAVDTKFKLSTCMEHSPRSILETISTSTGSPLGGISNTRQKSFILPKLITEESILSATLWSLLHKTTGKEQSSSAGLEESNASASRRVMQQTKQLLLDCVRELVVDHDSRQGGFAGSEEIGNAICEKIRGWGKQCGDETNMKEMLELDVMEWCDFEIGSGKREMSQLLGNAIVEEITSEVVMDMITINIII